MSQRIPFAALVVAASFSLGTGCPETPQWSFPRNEDVVDTYSFDAILVVHEPFLDPSGPQITLNGVPVPAVEGPAGTFTVSLAPGPPLRDENTISAKVPITPPGRGTSLEQYRSHFFYRPPGKASAFQITRFQDLLTGPLAHNRKGDFMLSNDMARFVVQAANQRDLHSVGQFGGNLIDAELRSNPGSDNFFEMQPSVNIESVINATTVTVLNDGEDGTAAIVESCGPDDLLDYINASSQVAQFGVGLPIGVDDQDYDVTGCTRFELAPRLPGERGNQLAVTTTITNDSPTNTIGLFPGDYLNGMGELEQYTRLDPVSSSLADAGIGELLAIPGLSSFSYFGFGAAQGVSYGRIGIPTPSPFRPLTPDSSFSTSGVSFVLADNSIIQLLVPGIHPPTALLGPGESTSFSRVMVVGDGDVADIVDAEVELLGETHGTLSGCVTVGGVPAPGTRVTAGDEVAGRIAEIVTAWVTDSAGCYTGQLPIGTWAVAAAREGTPYEGGGTSPMLHPVAISDGGLTIQDIALPATGRVHVQVTDPNLFGDPALPARITVVGFDPSPTQIITFNFLFTSDGGTFNDVTKDPLPFGVSAVKYAGVDGLVDFDLEPGDYQLFVSRGTEYSRFDQPLHVVAGATTNVAAQITRVLDTTGFVSSDFHVHAINSPDSRISVKNRVDQFAGEGIENYIATDHDARTDPNPTIQAEGLGEWLKGTIGEEITTFDTGHYNGYPLGRDPARPSGGSTDWARPAPAGQDFPSLGAFIRSPAEIEAEVASQLASDGTPLNTASNLTVQINHIGSHFGPLRIDTSVTPPHSFLTPAERSGFRLDPAGPELFHPFPALELWNGSNRNQQAEFIDQRIGIWMNLLNQGFPTTFIADTDTHTFLNLRTAGARTWTAAPKDAPDRIDPNDVAGSVRAGRATGGQGLFIETRLRETDTPSNEATLDWMDSTSISTGGDGNVTLVIDVQAPVWAQFDTVEIFANGSTFPVGFNGGTPVDFDAVPTQTLVAGSDFSLPAPTLIDPAVPGAFRQDLHLEIPFSLSEDTWFVVVVRGSDGVSEPMFPVFASDLTPAGNLVLADLLDGNLGEGGVVALGATNALYADVDGNPGFDAPGVRLAP